MHGFLLNTLKSGVTSRFITLSLGISLNLLVPAAIILLSKVKVSPLKEAPVGNAYS